MNKFYSFHWMQVEGKEIINKNTLLYYTPSYYYDLSDMKDSVISSFSLPVDAVITIQNITEIDQEEYEQRTGKPFQD